LARRWESRSKSRAAFSCGSAMIRMRRRSTSCNSSIPRRPKAIPIRHSITLVSAGSLLSPMISTGLRNPERQKGRICYAATTLRRAQGKQDRNHVLQGPGRHAPRGDEAGNRKLVEPRSITALYATSTEQWRSHKNLSGQIFSSPRGMFNSAPPYLPRLDVSPRLTAGRAHIVF
jgi:hypothetical protein